MTNSEAPKHHVTETPDVSYIKNIDVTHEVSDVYVGGIVKFVIALFLLTVAVFILMWGTFRIFEARTEEPERSPMALTDTQRLPPEPRLQGAPGFAQELSKTAQPEKNEEGKPVPTMETGAPRDPLWEIRELRRQWNDVLENGPVDKNGNHYGMPIEKAEDEVLKQLPVRKQPAQ